uniref:Shikimate kinase n=1 Tax=Magnetococcus massalia (strain MO-1) TaxID=451514 RepID=A0A1S7LN79_MAGMO|nr:Shikimate kinase [Candidatus Magnetococcus massalia]
MNIALIGMRGAGKSNISRRLSLFTKRPVLSTDLLVRYEQEGQTIAEIVDQSPRGWQAFRDLEYQVVHKASMLDEAIIDCGGGVIVDLNERGEEIYSSRKVGALKRTGVIVWLRGDITKLAEKAVAKDPNRPTLDATQSLEALMQHRLPFYEKAADIVVDIDNKKRKQLAEEILTRTSESAWQDLVKRRGHETG